MGNDPPGQFTRALHPRVGRHGQPPPEVIAIGRSVIVPANGSLPNIILSPRSIPRIKRVLAREKFDILHLHEPMTPTPCIAALAIFDGPMVGTHHASGDLGWMRLATPVWGFLEERLDRRIAVSEQARASAQRWLPGEYEIVPNGVLIPEGVESGDREHRVVFAGRQEPRKGLQILLRAWPEIRRRTGARLRIAGADPLAVRLLLTRLRVSDDGIDVLGFLTQDALTQELSSAKALVAPSLGGESFGMVLTRAFACANARRRIGHPRLPRRDDAGDVGCRRRPAIPEHSRIGWRNCSPTRPGAPLLVPPRGSSRSTATPGRTSPAGWNGSTTRHAASRPKRRRHELHAAEPLASRAARHSTPSAHRRPALVAWPGLERRLPRVRSRQLGLGRVRARAQPHLGAPALARLEADDRPGARAAAAQLHSGLLRVLGRDARERGPSRTDRGARAGGGAATASAARPGRKRDARGDGLRTPALRRPRGAAADPLRGPDGQGAALGDHQPRDRLDHGCGALHRRVRDRPPAPPTDRRCCARSASCSRWPDRGSR